MSSENDSKNESKQANDKEQDGAVTPPADNLVQTKHTITIGGDELNYTVTTGTIVLKEEENEKGHQPKAEMFFVAYTKDDVTDVGQRPLTFSFNGGPGSSSVWLHLGILGPRRVPISETDETLRPPYQLEDNQYTLLTESDLVFIDPVSTGYSRPVEGEKQKQFFTYKKDIETVGEFIRLYTTRHKRWASPKFIIGESYGTTRAAGLSAHLLQRHGMYLNGIMLISSILNFQTARFQPGNDLPYSLFLPTYAAAAWYHKKISPQFTDMPLEVFLKEVTAFAESEYTLALMKGDRLGEAEKADVMQMLTVYTGLSAEYVERTNLRINIHRFVKELLRENGETIGRFDARITGRDRDEAGENIEYDPSFSFIYGAYAAGFNQYVRAELEYESDLPYEILSWNVFPNWKYDSFQNTYVNTAEPLRKAMTQNPHMKIFVGNGYYDLATPYFATEYTMHHLGIKPELQDNIEMAYYGAGHMMYAHQPSFEQLGRDLRTFVRGAK